MLPPMDIVNRSATTPFITKDGSEIRELLAYRNSSIRNQSLAEATIAAGAATQEHYHPNSEEIYYILSGSGRMKIDGDLRDVGPLDAIAIPPGAHHKIWNTGRNPLVLLCCCAPAYENDDTVMLE
jgi:mannose-6-phosphate isomerase-like protein (cupin superfamily)